MENRKFKVWRGNKVKGKFKEYTVQVEKGMVILDVIHSIQATQAGDLAARWNCKAGKCGSCSVEINGKPRLGCMTRLNEFNDTDLITIAPIKSFPVIRDLVSDVSWNYEQNKKIAPLRKHRKP